MVVVVVPRVLPSALGREAVPQTFGSYDNEVGDHAYFKLDPLGARGRGPVRVRSARLTGVPEGLEVVAFHAVNSSESPRVAAADGLPQHDPRLRLHPVDAIRLVPGEPERWYLLVVVRLTRPGTWRSTGVAVSWSRGWRRGTVHLPYAVQMTTEPQPPPGS